MHRKNQRPQSPLQDCSLSTISGAEIARYLGVNTSSINRTLARMDELIEK
jgi:hypothetical protein